MMDEDTAQQAEYVQTVEQWLQDYDEYEKEKSVPIYASEGEGSQREFAIVPEGTHVAVCDMLVNLGIQETYYGDKHQVYIRWQIPGHTITYNKDGEELSGPMTVGSIYTLSLFKNATLFKDLEMWRGQPFTKEELKLFDITAVLGTACQLQVSHRPSKDGSRTYANVRGVFAMPKDVERPKVHGEAIYYDAETHAETLDKLPNWLQEKVAAAKTPEAKEAPPLSDPEPFDDDIPF